MKKVQKTKPAVQVPDNDKNDNLIEYPQYPGSEDIYKRFKKEKNTDPEDLSKAMGKFKEDATGRNLDIPGSELDDEQEDVGNEDEENNYYSIGGDNHNDLDEDKNEL
jgi:hypothetical protein